MLPHLTQYSVLTLMTLDVSNHHGRLLASGIYSKSNVNNKPVFDRNLTLINHGSTVHYWGQEDHALNSEHA